MWTIGTRESLCVFLIISWSLGWKAKYLIITTFQCLSLLPEGLDSVSLFLMNFILLPEDLLELIQLCKGNYFAYQPRLMRSHRADRDLGEAIFWWLIIQRLFCNGSYSIYIYIYIYILSDFWSALSNNT